MNRIDRVDLPEQAEAFLRKLIDRHGAVMFHQSGGCCVVAGRGSGFSLEAPEGVRFVIRSRLPTDAEFAVLEAAPFPPTGADGGAL